MRKNARPQPTETSAREQGDSITIASLKARLQAGEIVGALDYPEADRPLFWSAITVVRDSLPCIRPVWRTISEQYVNGLRTRQKLFKIFPRQQGGIDSALAGLSALATVGAAMLIGGLL